MKERQGFLDRQHPHLSLRRRSFLLAVSRTAGYYKAVTELEDIPEQVDPPNPDFLGKVRGQIGS